MSQNLSSAAVVIGALRVYILISQWKHTFSNSGLKNVFYTQISLIGPQKNYLMLLQENNNHLHLYTIGEKLSTFGFRLPIIYRFESYYSLFNIINSAACYFPG